MWSFELSRAPREAGGPARYDFGGGGFGGGGGYRNVQVEGGIEDPFGAGSEWTFSFGGGGGGSGGGGGGGSTSSGELQPMDWRGSGTCRGDTSAIGPAGVCYCSAGLPTPKAIMAGIAQAQNGSLADELRRLVNKRLSAEWEAFDESNQRERYGEIRQVQNVEELVNVALYMAGGGENCESLPSDHPYSPIRELVKELGAGNEGVSEHQTRQDADSGGDGFDFGDFIDEARDTGEDFLESFVEGGSEAVQDEADRRVARSFLERNWPIILLGLLVVLLLADRFLPN